MGLSTCAVEAGTACLYLAADSRGLPVLVRPGEQTPLGVGFREVPPIGHVLHFLQNMNIKEFH